ncbi:hypothetical protein TNCV_4735361 [Trichonephila clavipes]|nr:hypothetical protein TNCV_4735361 [Trichonephila clavipes]
MPAHVSSSGVFLTEIQNLEVHRQRPSFCCIMHNQSGDNYDLFVGDISIEPRVRVLILLKNHRRSSSRCQDLEEWKLKCQFACCPRHLNLVHNYVAHSQ